MKELLFFTEAFNSLSCSVVLWRTNHAQMKGNIWCHSKPYLAKGLNIGWLLNYKQFVIRQTNDRRKKYFLQKRYSRTAFCGDIAIRLWQKSGPPNKLTFSIKMTPWTGTKESYETCPLLMAVMMRHHWILMSTEH